MIGSRLWLNFAALMMLLFFFSFTLYSQAERDKKKLSVELESALIENPTLKIDSKTKVKTDALLKRISESHLGNSGQIRAVVTTRGIKIWLNEGEMFPPGSTAGVVNLKEKFLALGELIQSLEVPVEIVGHSDSESDSKNSNGLSAWQISTARAEWILDLWRENNLYPVGKVGILAMGTQEPIASSDTNKKWSGTRNRRVEILILN